MSLRDEAGKILGPEGGEEIDLIVAAMEENIGKPISEESKDLLALSYVVMATLSAGGHKLIPLSVAAPLTALIGAVSGRVIRYAERVTMSDIPDKLPQDWGKPN